MLDLSTLLPLAQAQPSSGGYRELIDSLARTPLSEVVRFVVILSVVRLALFPLMSRVPVHKRGVGYGLLRFVNELLDAIIYAGVFVFLIIRPFLLQAFLIPSGSMWPTLYVNDFIVANKAIYRYSEPKRGDIVVFRPPASAILDPNQIDKDGQVKVDFIKRLVGMPGEVVELRDGVLYRDGKKAEEPYVHYTNQTDESTFVAKTEAEVAAMSKASFKLVKWNDKLIPLNYTAYDANSPMPRSDRLIDRPYAVAQEYLLMDPDDQEKAKALPAQPIPKGYFLMMGDNRNGSFDGRGWGLVPRESIIGRSEFIWMPLNRWGKTR